MTLSLIQIFVIAYIIKIINIALCCILIKPENDYFHCFSCGGSFLKRKCHLKNPIAIIIGPDRLAAHKLNFVEFNNEWEVATIDRDDKKPAWGGIWKLENNHLISLHKQVSVDGIQKKGLECEPCFPLHKSLPSLPNNEQTSITYKKVILNGEKMCHVPEKYVDALNSIPSKSAVESLRRRLKFQ